MGDSCVGGHGYFECAGFSVDAVDISAYLSAVPRDYDIPVFAGEEKSRVAGQTPINKRLKDETATLI